MIFRTVLSILLIFIFVSTTYSQNHHPRFESIDVQHYKFEIHLNDTTNRIEGKTNISVEFLKPAENCVFDLIEVNSENKGMSVKAIKQENGSVNFIHRNNQLIITLDKRTISGEVAEFEIYYSGVPADGLVISENKYGERTFFGDNWPDHAKNWLPCVDHPSDKATLEFLVYAPEHYEVISNGYFVEKRQLENNVEFTYWKEDVPISTKLMVIGAADFAIGNKTNYRDIPVSSWVFMQNKEQGFKNYKYGTEALEYFSKLIGPYSYEKLAHVQSKTRYGGMENASCIFYSENTAINNQSQERLFVHEVAHQWFGNSVSEQNWHHVWLSEGFATYLTHVYKQHFYGEEVFREGLKKDRERVINYSKRNLAPIIDTTVNEHIRLLNTNSYQKASWFLHMLREDLGDEVFFIGLQKYYVDFQNSTALTKDFQNTMEKVSGKNLDMFFKQWLWQPGHPVLNIVWEQETNNYIDLILTQKQKNNLFAFRMELKIIYDNGNLEYNSYFISNKQISITIPLKYKVKEFVFDPNVKLLFEIENP